MIYDRAFCAVLAVLLLVGVLLAPDGFARATTLLGACACAVTTALCDRIRQAAVEARVPSITRRCIDHDLIAEDWPVLAATLDAAAQSRHGAPLAELAAEVRAEVRS